MTILRDSSSANSMSQPLVEVTEGATYPSLPSYTVPADRVGSSPSHSRLAGSREQMAGSRQAGRQAGRQGST
jgi:hypothetical protein